MEKMKHTPGPWRVHNNGTVPPTFAIGDEKQRVIADHIALHTAKDGSGYANARLIASAPDLLAALVNLLDSGSWHDDGSWVYYPPDHPDDDEGAIQLAAEAIAKATGGTP